LRNSEPNHYATLGLDQQCTEAQVQAAYRILAKRFHPDINPDSPDAIARTREINAAYEVLSDASRRAEYDRERLATEAAGIERPARGAGRTERNVAQDVHLKIEEFLRGTNLDVKVIDPSNPDGPEVYQLIIPPETAPGARFRIPREGAGKAGFVTVRARALPGYQFKVRGSDLRCDLKINFKRAAQGGNEMLRGANGSMLRVPIPPGVASGEVIRIAEEGLPKPRGGRGDLLVRIMYRPEVKITRSSGR
jgi:DnaJ-class molecular chaperone